MKQIVVLSAALFIFTASIDARNIKSTGNNEMIPLKKTETHIKAVNREDGKVSVTLESRQNGSLVYASLPVRESYIPDDVIAELSKKYGTQFYDVTAVREDDNQTGYVIRLMKDGEQLVFQKVTDL